MGKSGKSANEWIADWAEDEGWQPRLIADGVSPSLDIWFPTEEACTEWIEREIMRVGKEATS